MSESILGVLGKFEERVAWTEAAATANEVGLDSLHRHVRRLQTTIDVLSRMVADRTGLDLAALEANIAAAIARRDHHGNS